MTRFVYGLLLAGLASTAQAQQGFFTGNVTSQGVAITEPGKLHLNLTVEQTMLIVQTLGQIGCQTVEQLARCNDAAALLAEIKRQAKAQGQ